MNVEESMIPQLKPAVVLTGTALERSGPPVGLFDIGVGESAYFCRVSLPGVRKTQSNFNCHIQTDGSVHIEGVITGAGVLKDPSSVYEVKVQQLCPPGPFTVSFNLPGPVDPRLSSYKLKADGILEVIVKKAKRPSVARDGFASL